MSLGSDERATIELVAQAIDKGINFFDTADLYNKGDNETALGKAVKPHRKKVVLATKVGNQWRSDGSGWDWNPRKEYILQAAEASLKRLQTDYIDLYQLHWPERAVTTAASSIHRKYSARVIRWA